MIHCRATRQRTASHNVSFKGFDPSLLNFLDELAQNNEREWFAENKDRYEKLVREPALDFIVAMGPLLDKIAPQFEAVAQKDGRLADARVSRHTLRSRQDAVQDQRRHSVSPHPGQRRARAGVLPAHRTGSTLHRRRHVAARPRGARRHPQCHRRAQRCVENRARLGHPELLPRWRRVEAAATRLSRRIIR